MTREDCPPLADGDLGFLIFRRGTRRMIEESIANKIILLPVVSADENERQCPARSLAVGYVPVLPDLLHEGARLFIPAAKMPVKTPMRFVGQVDEYGFQPDLGRLSVVVEIAPAMKIMLVHHRPPVQPLRS